MPANVPQARMSKAERREFSRRAATIRWTRERKRFYGRVTHTGTAAVNAYSELVQMIDRSPDPQAPEMARCARRLLGQFHNLWELGRLPGSSRAWEFFEDEEPKQNGPASG